MENVNEIVMYESSDGAVKLPVRTDYGEETVWLTQAQIAGLRLYPLEPEQMLGKRFEIGRDFSSGQWQTNINR